MAHMIFKYAHFVTVAATPISTSSQCISQPTSPCQTFTISCTAIVTYLTMKAIILNWKNGQLVSCQEIQRRMVLVVIFFSFLAFLAPLHEVQKSYCSHPGLPRSRSVPVPFPSHFVKVF